MKNIEKFSPKIETEQEKRARLISRYIENQIIGKNETIGDKEGKEIKEYFDKLSASEKANVLYSKVMAYIMDKRAELSQKTKQKENDETFSPDSYLVSEIKILFEDAEVKDLIPVVYGEARVDAKEFHASELGKLWSDTEQEIQEKEKKYKKIERELHLNQIEGRGKVSSAQSRLAILANNLSNLKKRKLGIETLQGIPNIAENTDVAANLQYEKDKKYKQQLDNGFVWLPSREEIHQKTVSAILNHRWPVLIGEAGTGKSDQADAAALELTGYLPTEIECESTIGELQLIKDNAIDPETGGSYDQYGPLMQAFTGYDDSIQKEPSIKTGRIARFDESGRMGPKAYSAIKKARQKKVGEDFYGKPMLSGAGAIWTSNPVGPRYPDRYAPDPAMRRELAEIFVDYPEMSNENPELYDFATVALFDENNHIQAVKEELSPFYERKEIPADQQKTLNDGSKMVAENKLVENMADGRHGSLWRFCGAIKAVQDSFIYGNAEVEKYPESLLRFKEDVDGNIEIMTNGEPLTLSTSTITLGELASWMKGFNERRQKQDENFRVETLTEWIDFKINTYLSQADEADKEKIRAIFKHFHFLENNAPDIKNAKPLTPKEIGYLSPRVPRPVEVEKPAIEEATEGTLLVEKKDAAAKEYETKKVLLENGNNVLIKKGEFVLNEGSYDLQTKKFISINIANGVKFKNKGSKFIFAGVVQDETSPFNGKPVGQRNGEEIYEIFSSDEVDAGIIQEFIDLAGELGVDDFQEDILACWDAEGCKTEYGAFNF